MLHNSSFCGQTPSAHSLPANLEAASLCGGSACKVDRRAIYILLSTAQQLKLTFLFLFFFPSIPPPHPRPSLPATTSLHRGQRPGASRGVLLCVPSLLTPPSGVHPPPHLPFLLLPILISAAPCPPALARQSPVRALSLTCARLSTQTLIKERPLKAQQMLKIKGLFKWFPVEALGEIREKREPLQGRDRKEG